MSALQNENKSRKRGLCEWRRGLSFQRHPYLSHRGAISTQRGTLSNLLPDWYVTRGRNLFPSAFSGCLQSSVFLAELSEYPVINPLLPLSCFRKSPLSTGQMTRRGSIYNDVRNSPRLQGWRSKIILNAGSARSLACEGPP